MNPLVEEDKQEIKEDSELISLHSFVNYSTLDIEQTSKISFDDLLSRSKIGKYQHLAYFFIGLVIMFDGAEAFVLSLLVSILKKEWEGSSDTMSMMGTCVFSGLLIGSLGAGKISDRFGRRKPLIYTVVCQYLCAVMCAFTNEFSSLIFFRSLLGFFQGFQVPLSSSYLSEITPKEVRGRYLVLIGIIYAVGELFTCFIGFFTLEGTQSGNWGALLLWVAQPALIGWLGLFFFLDESPRYELMTMRNLDRSLKILERIAHVNGEPYKITEGEQLGVMKWMKEITIGATKEDAGNLRTLFNNNNLPTTIYLWPVWACIVLVNHGIVFILPLVLSSIGDHEGAQRSSHKGGSLWGMVYAAFSELPAVLLASWLVEHDKFGRKKTVSYGLLITAFCCIMAWMTDYFSLFVAMAKGSTSLAVNVTYAYTLELYPTAIRVTGLGTAYSFGRIGQIAMPLIATKLYEISPKDPYLGYSLFCLVGAWCCWNLKKDTMRQDLH